MQSIQEFKTEWFISYISCEGFETEEYLALTKDVLKHYINCLEFAEARSLEVNMTDTDQGIYCVYSDGWWNPEYWNQWAVPLSRAAPCRAYLTKRHLYNRLI